MSRRNSYDTIERVQPNVERFQAEIIENKDTVDTSGKYTDPNYIIRLQERIRTLEELKEKDQKKIDIYTNIIPEYESYLMYLDGICNRQCSQFMSQTEF